MLMTPEEFDSVRTWDDLYRYELVNGVLIVAPIPSAGERSPSDELYHLLRLYQTGHPQGSSLDGMLPEQYIHLAGSRRRADRVIWAGLGRLPDPDKDVPSIAVEFVSNRTRDRTRDYEEKRREYLAVGVKEYWVIDRFERTMTVFRQPPAATAEEVVPAEATYRTPLLPGFELPIARLFQFADAWKPPKSPRKPGK
jgi:Uma2 family endonuclease